MSYQEKKTTGLDQGLFSKASRRLDGVPQNERKKREIDRGELENSLFVAANCGDVELARAALSLGANPNCQNSNGQTPLQFAILAKQLEVMRELFRFNADVDCQDCGGNSALHYAVAMEDLNVLELVCAQKPNLQIQNNDEETVLDCAIDLEDRVDISAIINLLKKGKFDFNIIKVKGFAPFLRAVDSGNLKAVQLLFDAGAMPNLREAGGLSALYKSVSNGSLEMVSEFLKEKYGMNVEEFKATDGCTLLLCAANKNRVDIARKLLKAGALPDARNNKGSTALHVAALKGNTEMVLLLRQYGADVACLDSNGFTPLMCAQSNEDVVNSLKQEVRLVEVDEQEEKSSGAGCCSIM